MILLTLLSDENYYRTELNYPRPKNLFAESLTELDDALRFAISGYKNASTVKLFNHYRRVNGSSNIFNFELRQIVPKLYRPFKDFVYFTKPLPVDIRVSQLESKIESRNSIAGLFKMANGDYGFAALRAPGMFSLIIEDKSIRNLGKIRNEEITEIVYLSPKENAVNSESGIKKYQIVVPNETLTVQESSIFHKLTRKDVDSRIQCDKHEENCAATDYVTKLEEMGIEVPEKTKRLVMPSTKISSLKLKVNRKLPEEGPAIKHKKAPDHKKRQQTVLHNALDIFDIREELTESNHAEMANLIEKEIDELVRTNEGAQQILETALYANIETVFDEVHRELNKLQIIPSAPKAQDYTSLSLKQMLVIMDLNNLDELNDLMGTSITADETRETIVNKLKQAKNNGALNWYFMLKERILDKTDSRFNDKDMGILIKHIMKGDLEAVYESILSKYDGSKTINKQLNKLARESSIFMCVPSDALISIVSGEDQEIKSGIETRSGADYQGDATIWAKTRIATEVKKLGTDPTDFTSYHKYGFVSTKNYPYVKNALQYGNIILEFSDHVKERATLCIGDSFKQYNPPMPFDDLDIDKIACNIVMPELSPTDDFLTKLRDLTLFLENIKHVKQGLNVESLFKGTNTVDPRDYFEAQIKGTLSIDDVKTIYLPPDIENSLYKLLEEGANIPDHITFATHKFEHTTSEEQVSLIDDIKDRVSR